MTGGCSVRGIRFRYFPGLFAFRQKLIDPVANLFGLIEDEQNFGSPSQLQPFDQFVAHVTLRRLQSGQCLRALRFILEREAHVNPRRRADPASRALP